MIDRDHKLSTTRQADLLRISRDSVYYLPGPVCDVDLHHEHPLIGARVLYDQFHRQCIQFDRHHVGSPMQRMGIAALAPQPGTS